MYNKEATIETARQGAAPPRGGGEEEGEGEGGAGIDPVSMGAVRPPRRQGSARRPLRPGRYGAMKSKILGTWEGQKKRTLGGCMGRRQSPNGGRRGLWGPGRAVGSTGATDRRS